MPKAALLTLLHVPPKNAKSFQPALEGWLSSKVGQPGCEEVAIQTRDVDDARDVNFLLYECWTSFDLLQENTDLPDSTLFQVQYETLSGVVPDFILTTILDEAVGDEPQGGNGFARVTTFRSARGNEFRLQDELVGLITRDVAMSNCEGATLHRYGGQQLNFLLYERWSDLDDLSNLSQIAGSKVAILTSTLWKIGVWWSSTFNEEEELAALEKEYPDLESLFPKVNLEPSQGAQNSGTETDISDTDESDGEKEP